MTTRDLARTEILSYLSDIVSQLSDISEVVSAKLCRECGVEDPEWSDKRERILDRLKDLVSRYAFSDRLPQDETGVLVLSVISHLLRIEYSFSLVVVMIDMIRGGSFQEVYMDSLSAIASKVNSQFKALGTALASTVEDPESATESYQAVMRLEREIDEDNIVICRQVSVATGGDSTFVCYIMRKIVSEMEHISDSLKEIAEVLIDY